ncbi:MAG: PHP domain-containing protein, partial [Spirochaetaceae bacterium]|nr:PHP domain-containing protein [Spirochaetaceae bacterium]
ALSIGAIPAYAYLGDVEESPTGDKRAEQFEDAFLPELFEELRRLGYKAVTYMPPRNSSAQIARIQKFCADGDLMEISGVDINSSRQSFNCPEVLDPSCRHLVDTTWALIAHERLASADSTWGIFSSANPFSSLSLGERIILYAKAGKSLDLYHPEESVPRLIEKLHKGRFL